MFLRLSDLPDPLKNYEKSYKLILGTRFMREQIKQGKKFNIISRSIDNATGCTVIDVFDDSFKVKLDLCGKYEVNESVELFTVTSKGRLYFETFVKEVENDIVTVWFPIVFKYLQRREYSRVTSDKTITLNSEGKEIFADIIDISAGGLKVIVPEQLTLLKGYKTNIIIDNKKIELIFEPVRIEAEDSGFIVSGRFKDLNNYDRIALVQYSFIKQIESADI